ncbi:MAG: GNAT family N-acetyltransferase [Dysgonamonadaceae bacterium]|jgi:predicted GNAT family N-acyltransferase|nr:GNAT family N-acetyltransferase [Dysgonamonadaceae bacterium]
MDYLQIRVVKIEPDIETDTFDCGNTDLNAFLKDDALRYFDERMAVTYILLYKKQIIAYYCLLNDKVTFDTGQGNERLLWNRFNRKNKIPNPKRRQNYPAVKLGRLAVSMHFKRQGLGRFILDGIKQMLIQKTDTGCRFLTVDAYSTALSFYLKNEFQYISSKDESENTRLMYYDLKTG